MNHPVRTSIVLAGLALSSGFAFAQAATVTVAESGEYGKYLADSDGRALYLFESDTRGQGDAKAQISCKDKCPERWPSYVADGEPTAGENVDAAKLGTVEHDGSMVVTYNGWPLYHFVDDAAPGDTKGHDIEEFGAEWYLLTPEGEKAED